MLWYIRIEGETEGKPARYYVEQNHDRGIPEGEAPEEILVRVYLDRSDAERYADIVADYQLVDRTKVKTLPIEMKQLFNDLTDIDKASMKYFGAPIRIDICQMKESEHPESVTTLYTAFEERH